MEDMDLVSLFCSRICHDLISPVGAVGNGLELIAEDDPALAQRPEFRLAAQSATRAANTIAFFRLAFGGAAGGPVKMEFLSEVAASHLASERLAVQGPEGRGRLSRNMARLELMLALTGATVLPRGGTLTLAAKPGSEDPTPDGLEQVSVLVEGPVLRLGESARTAIDELQPPVPTQPRDAHLVALTQLARSTGALLRIEATDSELRLSATAPRLAGQTKAPSLAVVV